MKVSSKLLVAVVIFLCACSPVFAQTATTALRGTAADPSGAVVPGAAITLSDVASGLRTVRTTDSKGEYVFSPIEPGKYLITISARGFADQSKQAELLVDQPATINFALSVQAVFFAPHMAPFLYFQF